MTKNMLITGASAGIGAAIAELAANAGWNVGVGYRSDLDGANTTAAKVTATGQKAILLQGDTSNPDDVERIFKQFDTELGDLNAFINNAGIVDMAARVEDMSYARLTQMFNINLIGAFLTAGQAVKRMATRYGGTGGSIVNISSAAARLGGANQYVDYAASKGGIDTLTKGLADENAADGIRVNGVRPGLIETQIHAKGGEPDRAERLAHLVPMKRTGSAFEVAQAIVWLTSGDASYVTGTTIDVTGGR